MIIALTPYLSLVTSFEIGLRLQAAVIVVALGCVAAGSRRRLVPSLRRIPRPVQWALALYTAAALWGGSVGLFSGNPPRYLLGQLVAMLLLPAAALLFSAAPRPVAPDLAAGLAMAALVALVIHFGAGLLGGPAESAKLPSFFKLTNGADFVAPALLVLVVTAAWWHAGRHPLALWGSIAATVLIIGGMARAQWLVTVVAVALLLTLTRRWRPKQVAWLGGLVLLAVFGVFLVLVVSSRFGTPLVRAAVGATPGGQGGDEGVIRLTGEPGEARRLAALDVAPQLKVVEAEARVRGEVGETLNLWVTGRPVAGGPLVARWENSLRGSGGWMRLQLVEDLPEDVGWIGVGVRSGGGEWEVASLRVRGFESSLVGWVRRLSWRGHSLLQVLESPEAVGTLRYRIEEWRSIRRQWRRASWLRVLAGQGLGALFLFENLGWDASGGRVSRQQANYIHNFYVFLGFKLGLAGASALGGLILLAGWTAKRAWILREHADRWAPAAMAAAWIAYLLWSVTSPEILNFRMAPLWGAVVAASWRDCG